MSSEVSQEVAKVSEEPKIIRDKQWILTQVEAQHGPKFRDHIASITPDDMTVGDPECLIIDKDHTIKMDNYSKDDWVLYIFANTKDSRGYNNWGAYYNIKLEYPNIIRYIDQETMNLNPNMRSPLSLVKLLNEINLPVDIVEYCKQNEYDISFELYQFFFNPFRNCWKTNTTFSVITTGSEDKHSTTEKVMYDYVNKDYVNGYRLIVIDYIQDGSNVYFNDYRNGFVDDLHDDVDKRFEIDVQYESVRVRITPAFKEISQIHSNPELKPFLAIIFNPPVDEDQRAKPIFPIS